MSHPTPPGGSQTIDVYPGDLNSVAGKFATGQTNLDTIATALNNALQNAGGMAGNDEYGQKFGLKYDPAAKALFRALSAAVRAIGQAADALVTTANNYLKADHHSNPAKGKGQPKTYPWPGVFTDIIYPDPASSIGEGHSSVPSAIAKYWPNGDQDRLRDAAKAYRTASQALQGLGGTLHGQVTSLTDNNSDDSVHAMAAFWAKIWQDGAGTGKAPLSAAHHACDQLAKACDTFAHAIDQAHSSTEHKLAGAGILVGVTTVVGVLLTPFTFGGSDAGAGALDAAEAGAILGGVEVAAEEAVADIGASVIADVGADLDAAATAVPEIETVDATTTEADQSLDEELADTAERDPTGADDGPADGLSNSDRPAREGDTNYQVDNPTDPSDTITDIDRIQDGRLWEEKTATGENPNMDIGKWTQKHVLKKLDSIVRARQYMQGYENAPIGLDFQQAGATPAFRQAVESAAEQWRNANPGISLMIRWAE